MCQQTDSKDHHSRLNHLSPRCANEGKEYLFKNPPDSALSIESKPICVVLSPTPEHRRKADKTRHRYSNGTKSPDFTFVIELKPVLKAVHVDGTKSSDPTFSFESKPADVVPNSTTPENRDKANETRHSDRTKIVSESVVFCLKSSISMSPPIPKLASQSSGKLRIVKVSGLMFAVGCGGRSRLDYPPTPPPSLP